jgi:carbonic anhydrase
MVIHLVHTNSKGEIAVVALLVRAGGANATSRKLWSSFPAPGSVEKKAPGIRINAAGLLPANRAYYTYRGSLTTPPCTEGVTWFILKTPIEASNDQINAFAALFPHNARPIQPLGARMVRSTR